MKHERHAAAEEADFCPIFFFLNTKHDITSDYATALSEEHSEFYAGLHDH